MLTIIILEKLKSNILHKEMSKSLKPSKFSKDSVGIKKIYNSISLLDDVMSKFQHIQVHDFHDPNVGKMLMIDGDIRLTEKNEYIYHEMIVHVPLMCNQSAKRVLIIGGGDGGTCREVCKYTNLTKIVQVEMDPQVIDIVQKYFPNLNNPYNDPRVELIIDVQIEWIEGYISRDNFNKFDVIIMDIDLNISDSSYVDSFLTKLKLLMNKDALLVSTANCMNWSINSVKNFFNQQKQMFKYVRIYQAYLPMYGDGHYGFIISSNDIDPMNSIVEKQTFKDLSIKTKYYTPEIHRASFVLPKNIKDELFNKQPESDILGSHITIDMSGVPFKVINDQDKLIELFDHICVIGNLTCLNKASHKFEPQGVTICYLLSTSHMSIHTWPELGKCCIDLFTCLKRNKFPEIVDELILNLKPKKFTIKSLDRYI